MSLFNRSSKNVVSAFEKTYGISSKSFPNVFKLLAHSVYSRINNSDKLGSGRMYTAVSLRTRLSFVNSAIREALSRIKNSEGRRISEYVDKDTDFNIMILSLVKKYLNFYENDEDIYDIIVSAFTAVFLENGKRIFKEFDGTLLTDAGELIPVNIEPYIHTMLKREIIKQSKEISKHYKDRSQINPFEDESTEEALDREIKDSLKKFDHRDKLLYQQLVKELKKKFQRDSNPQRVEKIFDLLVLGYQKGEIAEELGVSATRVGDYVWYIKDMVTEVAKDLANAGDSELLNLLENQFKKK